MARALSLLAAPIQRCYRLAPHLDHELRRKLLYHITMIAGLELSGFAFLPETLQPLRGWVAKQYLNACKAMLNAEPSIHGHRNTGMVLEFIKRLGKPPEQRFQSFTNYSWSMMVQLKLFELANYNIMQVVNQVLMSVSPVSGLIPEASVSRAVNILKELYKARLWQILRSVFTRAWLGAQQREIGKQQFFDPGKLNDARAMPIESVFKEYNNIINAVVAGGGEPVFPFPLRAQDQASVPFGETPQQGLGPPGMGVGAQGYPPLFPQQETEGAVGHASPHQPELPSLVYVYPQPTQYQPPGHPPDPSAPHHALHQHSAGADAAQLHAGSSGFAAAPGGPAIGGAYVLFPQQQPQGAMIHAAPFMPFVIPGTQQPSLPGEYSPPDASADYGLWSSQEGDSYGYQQAAPGDALYYMGETPEDGYAEPGTSGLGMGAQAHPEFVSQQEPQGAEASAHHAAPTFFPQGTPGFMQGPPYGAAIGGPHGFMGGVDSGQQQPTGLEGLSEGVETAGSSWGVQTTPTASTSSAFSSESGAVGGQPVKDDELKELDKLLEKIKSAVDWSAPFDEESKSQPVSQKGPKGATPGVAPSSSIDYKAVWSPLTQPLPSHMQPSWGEASHAAAHTGPQTSTVGEDKGQQPSGLGEGAHADGAAGVSHDSQTGVVKEGKSASASKGEAKGGEGVKEEEDDSESEEDLLDLIQATLDWGMSSDTEDKR
ncbi:hypothetical protein Emed_004230 [Eimeria media]